MLLKSMVRLGACKFGLLSVVGQGPSVIAEDRNVGGGGRGEGRGPN